VIPRHGPDALAADGKEACWRDHPQVGVVGDLVGTLARPLRKISGSECLQTPGDASEQMLPMPAPGLLLEYFPILLTQRCQACPAQVLNRD
jgi:hypothetical protein